MPDFGPDDMYVCDANGVVGVASIAVPAALSGLPHGLTCGSSGFGIVSRISKKPLCDTFFGYSLDLL